jgi:FMN phosphatase YigB (HAD superfamily)
MFQSDQDTTIVSGTVGQMKPYPEVFDLLQERFGLLLPDCVLIDDQEENIEAAERHGIEGMLFTSEFAPAILKNIRKRLGYPDEDEERYFEIIPGELSFDATSGPSS